MLRKFLLAITLFALPIAPANAAKLIYSETGTITMDCGGPVCLTGASFIYGFPTFSEVLAPVFAVGPSYKAPLPQRYRYRIVLTTPGPALQTLSFVGGVYYNQPYHYEQGGFVPFGGDDNIHNPEVVECALAPSYCSPYGYSKGDQSFFTYDDGISNPGPYGSPSDVYNEGDEGLLFIAFNGAASIGVMLDPQFVGQSFTAQVFQSLAVPEPATWALFIIGFLSVGCAMRAKRELNCTRRVLRGRKSLGEEACSENHF